MLEKIVVRQYALNVLHNNTSKLNTYKKRVWSKCREKNGFGKIFKERPYKTKDRFFII